MLKSSAGRAAGAHERLGVALFYEASTHEDDDVIGQAHHREAVRHEQGDRSGVPGAGARGARISRKDGVLRVRIETGGRLVFAPEHTIVVVTTDRPDPTRLDADFRSRS